MPVALAEESTNGQATKSWQYPRLTGIGNMLANSVAFEDNHARNELWREQEFVELPVSELYGHCIDGRPAKWESLTGALPGTFNHFSSAGGRLPFLHALRKSVARWRDYNTRVRKAKACVIFGSYHLSVGSTERGCAGCGYDDEKAKETALIFVDTVNRIHRYEGLYAIHIGIETDRDALTWHGEHGRKLDLATMRGASAKDLRHELKDLFNFKSELVIDLLVKRSLGNLAHMEDVRDRPIEQAVHLESVLAVGRADECDSLLTSPNQGLILGPFDPYRIRNIELAAKVLLSNVKRGDVNQEHLVRLATASYYTSGYDKSSAIEEARANAKLIEDVLTDSADSEIRGLLPHLQPLTGVVRMDDRSFEIVQT